MRIVETVKVLFTLPPKAAQAQVFVNLNSQGKVLHSAPRHLARPLLGKR